MQRQTMTIQLILQLGGTLLTVIGLTFTMTQPLFTRIDALTLGMARLEENSKTAAVSSVNMERRLNRIETDLYTLQTKSDANTNARLGRQ